METARTEKVNKNIRATLLRETRRKPLTRKKDGHPFEVVNLVGKTDKGEFACYMYVDVGQVIPLNEERQYNIQTGQRGEYEIKEITDAKKGFAGGYAAKAPGQEIHAAALQCATQIALSGKLNIGPGEIRSWILAQAKELATEMIAHNRNAR